MLQYTFSGTLAPYKIEFGRVVNKPAAYYSEQQNKRIIWLNEPGGFKAQIAYSLEGTKLFEERYQNDIKIFKTDYWPTGMQKKFTEYRNGQIIRMDSFDSAGKKKEVVSFSKTGQPKRLKNALSLLNIKASLKGTASRKHLLEEAQRYVLAQGALDSVLKKKQKTH